MNVSGPFIDLASQTEHRQKQQAWLREKHLNLAAGIYARLVSHDYAVAQSRALSEANPLGLEAEKIGEVEFKIDLAMPARVACEAAECLLVTAGFIALPPEPEMGS